MSSTINFRQAEAAVMYFLQVSYCAARQLLDQVRSTGKPLDIRGARLTYSNGNYVITR